MYSADKKSNPKIMVHLKREMQLNWSEEEVSLSFYCALRCDGCY